MSRLRSPRQRDLRKGDPLWLDRRSHAHFPALRGSRDVDVVVVGGGLTGVLTALGLANAGASVCVIEAERVGAGSTGASSALLIHEPDRGFLDLSRRYGRKKAVRIWRLARNAVAGLVRTLKSQQVACALEEREAVYVAPTRGTVRALRKEFDARTKA